MGTVRGLTEADRVKRFIDQHEWLEVDQPSPWYPVPDEQLAGHYAGKSLRRGYNDTQYEVIVVVDTEGRALLVSGMQIVQLIDASGIGPGHPVLITYLGTRTLANGHNFKEFDLEVAELETE